MNGNAFIDTNIIIYFYSEHDSKKRGIACGILDKYTCCTNIQAFKEAGNIWYKKLNLSGYAIEKHIKNLELLFNVVLPINTDTIYDAIKIKDKYGFSFYDCIMLASAMNGECEIIFTEDMQDGQIINDTLKIINPFKTEGYK